MQEPGSNKEQLPIQEEESKVKTGQHGEEEVFCTGGICGTD